MSDLVRRRPIWFGGKDRLEASLDEFFAWLGLQESARVQLAVMDMWRAFSNAPTAKILFDQVNVIRHMDNVLDQVRKSEDKHRTGRHRRFIKGQKNTLLAHREPLTLEGRQSLLKLLLAANKRCNAVSLLQESFGQRWDYQREGWARCFFDQWCAALK